MLNFKSKDVREESEFILINYMLVDQIFISGFNILLFIEIIVIFNTLGNINAIVEISQIIC